MFCTHRVYRRIALDENMDFVQVGNISEEVGHDHVHTKSGRVAHIQHCTKCKSRSKALKTI